VRFLAWAKNGRWAAALQERRSRQVAAIKERAGLKPGSGEAQETKNAKEKN
jgi:hypothetical protein